MWHEWEWDDNGKKFVLTVTTNDEGIIFDVFDNEADESILTEAMTIDEWIEWMIQRDKERHGS